MKLIKIFRLALENIDLSNIIRNSRAKLFVTDDIVEINEILKEVLIKEDIKIVFIIHLLKQCLKLIRIKIFIRRI